MSTNEQALPPLPEPWDSPKNPFGVGKDLFTADQMFAYARAALTAEQPQSDVQRDAERALIAELRDALVGLDEAYCRAGSPLTRDERFEDRKRLIAARNAAAKAKERT